MITVDFPWALALLILQPWIVSSGRKTPWKKAADARLLPRILSPESERRRWPLLLFYPLLIIALAGIHVERGEAAALHAAIAVPLNGCLEEQKIQANQLIDGYEASALLAYDRAAYIIAPLTADRAAFRHFLTSLRADMALSPDARPDRVAARAAEALPRGGRLVVLACGEKPQLTAIYGHNAISVSAVLAPVLAGLFLLGYRRRLLILLIIFATFPARADWFSNARQRENRAISEGAERYRAGEYEAALARWQSEPNCLECLYNSANAQAFSGDIYGAVATLKRLLRQRPDHADARYNLEYLLRAAPPPPASADTASVASRIVSVEEEENDGDNNGLALRASPDDPWQAPPDGDNSELLRARIRRQGSQHHD